MRTVCRIMTLVMFLSVPAAAQEKTDYPYVPVPFTSVHAADGFWAPRMEVNRAVTIPYAFEKCEETGRIRNFAVAGGLSDANWVGGAGFNDSDVSKIIEGASYALMLKDDPELDKYLDKVISYYAAAQEDDGFLYTLWTANELGKVENYKQKGCRPNENNRWSNISSAHQLYNVGHMYEAGVAHYRATDKRDLLEVCIKNADLVCKTFNEDGLRNPPGHQEIEIGLARLYRVTGRRKYLDQAKFFLEMRGRHGSESKYNQSHKPVTEQSEAVGHAVRANYMYTAMADVAALTGDDAYIRAIERIWDNVVGTKLYITGGVGASRRGEAYGGNYHLPNKSAYCETCAAVANVFWNHRMFLLGGDAKYIDVMERSMYNNVPAGVSLEGNRFFYPNPLASDGNYARKPWFGCACCPSNIARFMPSAPGYVYATSGDTVYVNLYMASTSEIPVGGDKVKIRQQTRYPWDGRITLTVMPPEEGEPIDIALRIPGWARNTPVPSDLYRFAKKYDEKPKLAVNGESVPLKIENGYVHVSRKWKAGDKITLTLPMPVRRVVAHEKVADDRGRVAVQRGPIVYCAEARDNDGRAPDVILADDVELSAEHREDFLGGVTVITGELADGEKLTLVPYCVWANRGPNKMNVWFKTQAPADDAEFKSAFNGRDFSGWKVPKNNRWWKAENGILSATSGPKKKGSILWTEKKYRDFVIELDFRFGEGTIDSGVFLRTTNQQVQLGISGSLKRDMTGSVYVPGRGYPKEAEGVKKLLKPKDWNTLKVKATGNKYTIWLNGRQVLEFEGKKAVEQGPIGLQMHPGRTMSIDFRNIKIAEL